MCCRDMFLYRKGAGFVGSGRVRIWERVDKDSSSVQVMLEWVAEQRSPEPGRSFRSWSRSFPRTMAEGGSGVAV